VLVARQRYAWRWLHDFNAHNFNYRRHLCLDVPPRARVGFHLYRCVCCARPDRRRSCSELRRETGALVRVWRNPRIAFLPLIADAAVAVVEHTIRGTPGPRNLHNHRNGNVQSASTIRDGDSDGPVAR